MGKLCKSYCNQNLQTYKKECARELNAKAKKIEDLNIEAKKQTGHYLETYNKYYCLKKEIEKLKLKEKEELEKKLSPWHEKVNKLEQELKTETANFQFISNENTELKEKVA